MDKDSILLNPNCSELVWRLKGQSKEIFGYSDDPKTKFIVQILGTWVTMGWTKDRILTSAEIYVEGFDSEIFEGGFGYALDLVAGIRDPRELDYERELSDQLYEHGYDAEISKTWKPILPKSKHLESKSPKSQKSTVVSDEAERLLDIIWHTSPKSPRKTPKNTSQRSQKSRQINPNGRQIDQKADEQDDELDDEQDDEQDEDLNFL
jgi:hypothetical protein